MVYMDSNIVFGTHWVVDIKYLNEVDYFDSYDNIPYSIEVIEYFQSDSGSINITYN